MFGRVILAPITFLLFLVMSLNLDVIPHTLKFKFDARTSRGAMQQHQVYYLRLKNTNNQEVFGIGECAPLPNLSPEFSLDFINLLQSQVTALNSQFQKEDIKTIESVIYSSELKNIPSLLFALETAWLDLKTGGKKLLYDNSFIHHQAGIPINGLIWMGDKTFMLEQIHKKLGEGYSCLKLKIGSLDFSTELEILNAIRKVAGPETLTIRVDANGAFTPAEALSKLDKLASCGLHSIEQPIRAGQWQEMQKICASSPVPVALDEELIGIKEKEQKERLLQTIAPPYIILKPTLLGGIKATEEWIGLAEKYEIGWWITSALESNIGLNAISQFTAQFAITREQGLGTGQLYHNNINSPLTIRDGHLFYDQNKGWNLQLFTQ